MQRVEGGELVIHRMVRGAPQPVLRCDPSRRCALRGLAPGGGAWLRTDAQGDVHARSNQVDPIDFIECAPFTETRNYMMRVMENMQVYRARLNGGSAPLTPSADLARGTPPNSGPRAYRP